MQAPAGLCLLDAGLRFVAVNARLAEANRLPPAAHIGRTMADIAPQQAAAIAPALRQVLATGKPIEGLEVAWTCDGEDRVWLCSLSPVRDANGAVRQVAGAFTDITTRARSEACGRRLSAETDHRAKNTMSIARGLVRLSVTAAGDDAHALAEMIEGRIMAMSRVHAVLAREKWTGAGLREIATQELAPYAGRTDAQGPSLRLTAEAAQPLTLVLHELISNAAGFGALSTNAGHVALAWEALDTGVVMHWKETGGPPVAGPPTHLGFGSRLIDANLGTHLGGSIERFWDPDGLRCVLTIGAEAVAGDGSPLAMAGAGVLAGRRVLLVEDDETAAGEAAAALREARCEVLGPVTNSADALRMIETAGAFDAVVLAPTLQGCSVQPLAHLLRRRAIAVLYLSPLAMSPRDPPSPTVLTHPIAPQALRDALIAVLTQHGA
jgi:PAS domain S-box-containing protein